MSSACTVGIDVGGSGIKAYLVDPVTGETKGERMRLDSPEDFDVASVLDMICDLADSLGPELAVGVGFPSVVSGGVALTGATAHQHSEWIGIDIESELAERLGRHVVVINDADAAGHAEMRFGAGRDETGTVIILTFGTGVGSSLYRGGILVPNVELGHIYLQNKKKVAEHQVSDRARKEKDLAWSKWGRKVNQYLLRLERVFAPDLIVIGGGVSKKADRFFDEIETRARVVPAELQNDAGIVGAAVVAHERSLVAG